MDCYCTICIVYRQNVKSRTSNVLIKCRHVKVSKVVLCHMYCVRIRNKNLEWKKKFLIEIIEIFSLFGVFSSRNTIKVEQNNEKQNLTQIDSQ